MKRFLYPFYILLIVVILLPKEKFYFSMETLLAEYHLFINHEVLTDRFLYLDAENGEILIDNQAVASIEKIRISPWIFFNRLSVSNLSVLPLYRSFFPGKIDTVTMTYSLLNPLEIAIQGEGDFGRFRGGYDLMSHKLRIVFDATNELRGYGFLVSKLHQEKGGLVYESDF